MSFHPIPKSVGFLAILVLVQSDVQPLLVLTAQTFSTMSAAVDAIATQYQVRVGLELATNDPDRLPISLDLSGTIVAPALDSLVTQKPDYTWKVTDGVYNIYPKLAKDSVLNLHILTFSVTNATAREVSSAIGALPEVKEWMLRHGVKRREIETGSRWRESDPRVTLSLKNVPLRSILNHVLKERKAKEWIVLRYGEKQEYIAIYI